jgi:hypothetical protein
VKQLGAGNPVGQAAQQLVDRWKQNIQRDTQLAYAIEKHMYLKHLAEYDEGGGGGVASGGGGGASSPGGSNNNNNKQQHHSASPPVGDAKPRASSAASRKVAAWRYKADLRAILQLMRRDYNRGVKNELRSGEVSVEEFCDRFDHDKEAFDSPAVKRRKREVEDENLRHETAFSSLTDFPYFDQSLLCPSCKSKRDRGAHYDVIQLAIGDVRGEGTGRRISAQCADPDCGYHWQQEQ